MSAALRHGRGPATTMWSTCPPGPVQRAKEKSLLSQSTIALYVIRTRREYQSTPVSKINMGKCWSRSSVESASFLRALNAKSRGRSSPSIMFRRCPRGCVRRVRRPTRYPNKSVVPHAVRIKRRIRTTSATRPTGVILPLRSAWSVYILLVTAVGSAGPTKKCQCKSKN